jgi:tetratricopeptide (TPR) repeat protein
LHDAGQHAAAAVEYRRLALAEPDAGRGAGYRWAAAYEYLLAGKHELALRMLDRAEDGSRGFAAQMLLLRAEAAMAGGAPDEAAFHLESMLAGLPADKSSAALRAVATRRLGRARMAARDAGGARQALRDVPDAAARDAALAAIAGYERGRDRRPWLGGVLGVIPGLGHAYSGEYANAVRSLLLNGLFIYGMAHTARNDQWGAFAAIGFFELTWYTGSIYGGVDAAHRYNRERLDDCVRQVGGGAAFEPDLGRIPIVSIRVDL